jgi:hypothetical protein
MRARGSSLVAGFLLLVVGGILLANQLNPGLLANYLPKSFTWPWYVIGTGLVFLFFALLTGTGGLAVPGSVIGTIGFILYYQNQTGDWESWAFAWILIPAAVGLGIILMSLIEGHIRSATPGLWLLGINLAIFLVFWAIFRRDSSLIGSYWPVLLIVVGVFVLIQSLISRNRE